MLGFGEVAERLRRSTVQVFTKGYGGGSGVIWSADGLIVTNSHVIRTANPQVELWDGRRLDAQISSRDPRRDLAALRISAAITKLSVPLFSSGAPNATTQPVRTPSTLPATSSIS